MNYLEQVQRPLGVSKQVLNAIEIVDIKNCLYCLQEFHSKTYIEMHSVFDEIAYGFYASDYVTNYLLRLSIKIEEHSYMLAN